MKNRKVLLALVLVLSMILPCLQAVGRAGIKTRQWTGKNGEQQQTPANQPDDPTHLRRGKYKISWTNYQIVPAEKGHVLKCLRKIQCRN